MFEHHSLTVMHYFIHPYPLSLMSNSAKAGEAETPCGRKLRGDVMETRLMIWCRARGTMGVARSGVSEGVVLRRLNERFRVFLLWGPPPSTSSRTGGPPADGPGVGVGESKDFINNR